MSNSRKTTAGLQISGRKRIAVGFMEGLSAASLFIAGALPAPKPVHTSLASDWQAVGNDLRRATVMYGKKRQD